MKLQVREKTKLQQDSITATHADHMTFWQKGTGIVRILFGVAWAIAAILKWQPAFIQSFPTIVGGANHGQPAIVQAWISLWVNIVHINPTLFAFLPALVESLLAICFICGVFTNLASLIGIVWAFIIWSVPEGFGAPYVAGQSTDIGAAFPYILLCVLLLLLSSGRYLGIDRMLTPKLGRLSFLAAGPFRKQKT